MSTITITIAQLPSNDSAAKVVSVESGSTIGAALSSQDISSEGKTLKFNGVEVNTSSVVESDGMLTVTQGAKGNI